MSAPVSASPPPPHEALALLRSRYSLGARHLAEPGPDAAALECMTEAALRAPDHGGLVPYRFVVVRGAARERLACLFEAAAREAGKDDASIAMERQRSLGVPVTVAVVARIDAGHPLAPPHEQWIAVGGAIANFLNAGHALGFGGKLLSGRKVRLPAVQAAFCEPGETLVGWIVLGTPQRGLAAKLSKAGVREVLRDWPAR